MRCTMCYGTWCRAGPAPSPAVPTTTTPARAASAPRWSSRPPMRSRSASRSPHELFPITMKRLRILTWHVHGNYLYYLTQVPHDFYLVTDAERSSHHRGRSGVLPWGDNVHEARVEQIREMAFDV